MANSKTKSKNQKILYPILLIIPAIILIACSIIFKNTAIIPYILAYALVAAIPAFFMISKDRGLIVIITSIIFVAGITGYIISDNMLQKTSLLNDKEFITAMSSVLKKSPALISRKDLDKVKVLYLEGNYYPDYGYVADGFNLSLGYDEAAEYLQTAGSEYDEETFYSYMESAYSGIDITDFSSLALFPNLEYIKIYYQQTMNDISFFENYNSLKEARIELIAASDFSAFSNLKSLEKLIIAGSEVKDPSVFANLANLEILNLTACKIEDISWLGNLENLQNLFLSYNQISDLSVLSSMTNLEYASLDSNKIEDISALKNLKSIKNINLSGNEIKNVNPLTSLDILEGLDLSDNQIEDISPVFALAALKYLDISENNLKELNGTEKAMLLETLFFNGNEISDISTLSSLTSLKTLVGDNNQIADISILGSLKSLTGLSLKNNQIKDITPLKSLEELTAVYLDENIISDFSPLNNLEENGVYISGRENQLLESDGTDDIADTDEETAE
ncbi:MAG: leucine-rich repeat domain-containing protein [Oscillospiraceae bacterium]|nr:leucine-rich repeat domain-containing protein [Oscillospiraceae bacterium]